MYPRGTGRSASNDESHHFRNSYRQDNSEENIIPNSSFLSKVLDGTIALEAKRWLAHQLRAHYPDEDSHPSEPDPIQDYDQSYLKSKECHTIALIILGVLLIAVAGGGVMVYVGLLSPFTEDNLPKACDQLPPRFGNNCELRCHCSNVSEVCDKRTGSCQSGCIGGWQGNNCQIITSMFDQQTIFANLSSQVSVQCAIHKLWYNWSSVYLTFYNGTTTSTLLNVSQNGDTSISDQRLNATLSRSLGIGADNVTFVFDIREDDCDLTGMYECRFDMVDHFTSSYANLSMFVQGISSGLQISTKNEYYNGSTDYINCSLQLSDPSSNIVLSFIDMNNITLNSSSVQVHQVIENSLATCSNMTTFVFEINATHEINQSTAKCSMRGARGMFLESNGSIINIVSKSVSAYSMMMSSSNVVRPQSSFDVSCYIHLVNTDWEDISLIRYTNQSEEIVKMFKNGSMINKDNSINGVYDVGSTSVNVTFSFNLTKGSDQCSLTAIYGCEFQTSEQNLESLSFSNISVVVLGSPSDVEIYSEPLHQYGDEVLINCSAKLSTQPTSKLLLEVCLGDSDFVPIENYTRQNQSLVQRQHVNENCTQETHLISSIASNGIMNVSLRCRAIDSFLNVTEATNCFKTNISIPSVQVVVEPRNQVVKFGTTMQMFCFANVSNFEWSVIHLNFTNSSFSQRMVSTLHNGTTTLYDKMVNVTLLNSDGNVNISYLLSINEEGMICSLDGDFSCSIELLDSNIKTLSGNGTIKVTREPSIVEFMLQEQYKSSSNHTLNCEATFYDNSNTSLEVQICMNNSYVHISNDPAFLVNDPLNNFLPNACKLQTAVSYSFDFSNATNGTLLRCFAKDLDLNINKTTECKPLILKPTVAVVAEMTPTLLYAKLDTVPEMVCFIRTMGSSWTSVEITGHNSTASNVVLNVYNDSTIESKDSRVNGTVVIAEEYVNVTVILDTRHGSDLCEWNKDFSCEMNLIDPTIQTSGSNSSLIIEAPLSSIEISVEAFYVSGSNSTINCTAYLGKITETEVTFEDCREDGQYVEIREVARDILKINDDYGANCTNERIYRYHIPFLDIGNGLSVRCHGRDNLYGRNMSTSCVSINVTHAQPSLDPKVLYGKFNSTASFECRIPLLESYFSAFQFFNDSTPLLSINSDNNYTLLPQNDRISAVYTSDQFDVYRAVNFTFDLRPGDDLCNVGGVYVCRVKSFNQSLLLPADDESHLVIAAPPSSITIEIKANYSARAINETINCTAILNPNTTTLSLAILSNETYTMVPRNITNTITEPAMTDDCRLLVQVIITAQFDRFNNTVVACLAKDIVFGDFFSANETIVIVP